MAAPLHNVKKKKIVNTGQFNRLSLKPDDHSFSFPSNKIKHQYVSQTTLRISSSIIKFRQTALPPPLSSNLSTAGPSVDLLTRLSISYIHVTTNLTSIWKQIIITYIYKVPFLSRVHSAWQLYTSTTHNAQALQSHWVKHNLLTTHSLSLSR